VGSIVQTATVFNIQKFSLDDGPGIRTVVFLKGCLLRCVWCSNPESQRRDPQVEWKESACIGCGACCAAAPSAGAVERAGKRHVDIRNLGFSSPEAEAAIAACPRRAITRTGETKTAGEVLEICLQDKPFYEDSQGGVTLSGGEAMIWPEFCIELLSRLHEEGIDTCMETEAYVPQGVFQAVAAHLDHLLIDMKHADPAKHRAATGVGIDLIGANTRWAIEAGLDVLIRTPVVPDFNDSTEDARQMARRLRELGAERVQLLPFHNFGESKYALLDRDYALRGVKDLRPEDLDQYRQVFIDEGVEAFF